MRRGRRRTRARPGCGDARRFGLEDAGQWETADAEALKAELGAAVVLLNGPRYWTMDAFTGTTTVDPTVVTLAGIEMRVAGILTLSLADVAGGGDAAYALRTVARTTTWVYEAGQPVYELIDAEGEVYVMQSTESADVSEAAMAPMLAQLTLPEGWTARTRRPEAPLSVTAVDGQAVVVRDDRGNTYQLSQQ